MPKLACSCGYIHNLTPCPDHGWHTIRDCEYEQLIDAEKVIGEIDGNSLPGNEHPQVDRYDAAMAQIVSLQGSLYECPSCGALLWCKPGQNDFQLFYLAPEVG